MSKDRYMHYVIGLKRVVKIRNCFGLKPSATMAGFSTIITAQSRANFWNYLVVTSPPSRCCNPLTYETSYFTLCSAFRLGCPALCVIARCLLLSYSKHSLFCVVPPSSTPRIHSYMKRLLEASNSNNKITSTNTLSF